MAEPSDFWFWLLMLGVAVVGGGWLASRWLHIARLLEDTPTSRVRSAAQGYVELAGNRSKAMAGAADLAPLTQRPCVWWRDLNFEKYFDLRGLSFSLFLEVNNVLDNQNSTIINPVTGRAYEYGDDVPSSWNDARYPDVQAPINPYPYNPARYLTKRNIKLGVSFRF